jgi:hypothetical protein
VATVYSLICWGGSTGKAVTVSSSTDYVTLSVHGLRDGKGVQFVSGTLPTVAGAALALNTTYYAKKISWSTFELYYDSGLSSKINFTSNGASLVLKSAYLQGLADTSRWGSLIYDGLVSWNSGRSGASLLDKEVAELGEDFDEVVSTDVTINMPCASFEVTSFVNGVRSSAYHFGVVNTGYRFVRNDTNSSQQSLSTGRYFSVFDGFTFFKNGTGYGNGGLAIGGSCTCKNMVVIGAFVNKGTGISAAGQFCNVLNNLVIGWQAGIYNTTNTYGRLVANNTVSNCQGGFVAQSTSTVFGFYYNNIAVGNTTNWGTTSPLEGASNNAGLTGEAWITSGGTRITMATTDFADYAGAGTAPDWTVPPDFAPALFSSPQVDAGITLVRGLPTDIADAEVPNYNNGGSEAIDVGCYEFDHGYGNHPASHVLTLTNVIAGSRVHVSDQAGTVVHYDDIAAASTVVVTQPVYGDTRDNWRLRVRHASSSPTYQPYETLMTATAGSSSIYVSQIPDE